MKTLKLYWMTYRLFPYEKILGEREVQSLLEPEEILEEKNLIVAIGCKHPEKAINLVYFSKYELDGELFRTIQYERENTCEKKQNTRYFVHGIHEYKGKFNPQIVRSIMNICHISEGDVILDPFCGSGTSLLEAQLQGAKGYGIDINPMAAYIAKTKTNVLFNCKEILEFDIDDFTTKVIKLSKTIAIREDSRSVYLKHWFREDILHFMESWRKMSELVNNETVRDFLLLSLSNVLRDYSEQEPMDLRVRKRRSPYPAKPINDAVKDIFLKNQKKIGNFSYAKTCHPVHVITSNIQSVLPETMPLFDFAITSPPYATALPYIDTQRLSIVWLGLETPKRIKSLECSLTGTRETISKEEREKRWKAMNNNESNLCEPITNLCNILQSKLINSDGFRKQQTPFLLYKYFSEMAQMFENVHSMLKTGARYCLVVGYNKTKIGGGTVIDTPTLLAEEAQSKGFKLEEILPLNTYQRYGIHAKQAISGEALIILKA